MESLKSKKFEKLTKLQQNQIIGGEATSSTNANGGDRTFVTTNTDQYHHGDGSAKGHDFYIDLGDL